MGKIKMNWESDPRPLSECLKLWAKSHGWTRARAAHEIRAPISTYNGWCAGRFKPSEPQIRRLMAMIDDVEN